jgi:elongation factor G
VERALRVLDGGVLVLCGVSGVQSQSLTVDRQMKRYNVPRVAFINKLDRQGCNPWKVIDGLRKELKLNAAAVQVPIGLEDKHDGVVDIVEHKAYRFEGNNGENVTEIPVPADLAETIAEKRLEMIERLAEADEEVGELFLMEEVPDVDTIKAAIRRQTIACKFVPVFMGAAFKNKGVQPLLDGVVNYLPEPFEKPNYALDRQNNEEPVLVSGKNEDPLLALAFKLDETQFGQLTYMRIYQGMLKRGKFIHNVNDRKKIKLQRIVRMHSDDMEEITEAGAGEVVAMFGVDCKSMDTFSDGDLRYAMSSMFIPEPVMSLAVKPKNKQMLDNFTKALNKFTKEDPTLRIDQDDDTNETLLSGMGELHLEIYVERMLREYKVECITGQPKVNYKETIHATQKFDYLHKKQTGGQGQYARVIGWVEPLTEEDREEMGEANVFDNRLIGTNIPPEYHISCEKGMIDTMNDGALIGGKVLGIRVVLTDGASHEVDSSDLAFRTCMSYALREAMRKASPSILEPIMSVEVQVPTEFQGNVVGAINRRMGIIMQSDMTDDGSSATIVAEVPLANMFGYSTELRSQTQGKGEFTMEYLKHMPVPKIVQEELVKKSKETRHQQAAEDAA